MIDFVCMATENYSDWTRLCLQSISRFHPASTIHLYDLSKKPSKLFIEIANDFKNVKYYSYPESEWKWPAWVDKADFNFFCPRFSFREQLKYLGRRARLMISGKTKEGWMTDKALFAEEKRFFLKVVSQKPHILRQVVSNSANDLVFIDVDAIITKPLDAVFKIDFDLALTTEDLNEVVISRDPIDCNDRSIYPHRAINTGVIVLRNNRNARPILDAWIQEMESVYHFCVEQTSLANLIYRNIPDFFQSYFKPQTLALPGGSSSLIVALPMNVYNFIKTQLDAESFPEHIFVAHFVGSRKQQMHWEKAKKLALKQIST